MKAVGHAALRRAGIVPLSLSPNNGQYLFHVKLSSCSFWGAKFTQSLIVVFENVFPNTSVI